jgi:nitroreductase
MNNSVLEAIANRRSIRGYEPVQITNQQRDALIEAALQSPSAMDRQPWHFSVVQNAALLEALNAAAHDQAQKDTASYAGSRFSQPGYSVFYHAPTVFFISVDRNGPEIQSIDVGIAAENIALAAYGLGLGSIILGLPREAFLSERGDEFKKALAFPENYVFSIAVAVGVPATTKEAHTPKPGRVSIIE